MTFYTDDVLPIPRNDLLRCTYNAGKLEHVKMAPSFDHIDGIEDTGLACSLDVKVGPDGALYFRRWTRSTGGAASAGVFPLGSTAAR